MASDGMVNMRRSLRLGRRMRRRRSCAGWILNKGIDRAEGFLQRFPMFAQVGDFCRYPEK